MAVQAAVVFGAIAAAGAVASVWGQLSGASAEREAEEKRRQLLSQQADELERRSALNEEIMREEESYSELFMGSRMGASSGYLGSIIRARNVLERNIAISRHEAEFKARMMREGAQIDASLSSDKQTASYLNATGTLLTATARAQQAGLFGEIGQTPGST